MSSSGTLPSNNVVHDDMLERVIIPPGITGILMFTVVLLIYGLGTTQISTKDFFAAAAIITAVEFFILLFYRIKHPFQCRLGPLRAACGVLGLVVSGSVIYLLEPAVSPLGLVVSSGIACALTGFGYECLPEAINTRFPRRTGM